MRSEGRALGVTVAAAAVLVACSQAGVNTAANSNGLDDPHAGGQMVGMDMVSGTGAHPEHGLVLTTTTDKYLIVLDILAPEQMYTAADVAKEHPGAGELVVNGKATPTTGVNLRHMEVHVYDRATGAVVMDEHPKLTLSDYTDDTTYTVDSTEMRDIVIGEIDDHYGSNSSVAVGHEFSLHFEMNGEIADFTGMVK
ncbi:MAG: hypothetical protein ABJD24_14425 [Acidimicrobiales bacterium]